MKNLGKYLDERSLPRLGVLLCFSAVFMLFASPYTTPLNAYYGYDSAVFMSFGKGITHGLRLYLDLYDNKGPMIFYFNALGYLLGGRTGLWILQVVFMTFAFELSYRTARLFTGRGTAWLSVLVLLFLYCGTVGEGNMTEEWSLVFSLLPLWLSLRFIKTGAPAYRHPKWYSVIYGVCFGVNFMMRATNAAIVCGVLLAFAVLLCREKKFGALLLHIVLVLCGAALVIGPFALYFARIGAFDRFMYASFLHNFHYAAGGAAAKTAKDWLMYFARVSMVPVVIYFAVRQMKKGALPLGSALVLIYSCVFGAAVAVLGYSYKHYFLILTPALVPGFAVCAEGVRSMAAGKKAAERLCAAVLVFCLLPYAPQAAVHAGKSILFNFCGYLDSEKEAMSEIRACIDADPGEVLAYDMRANVYLYLDVDPCFCHAMTQDWMSQDSPFIAKELDEYLRKTPPKWIVSDASENMRERLENTYGYTLFRVWDKGGCPALYLHE